MNSVNSAGSSYGMEVLGAKMAKSQQEAEGQQSLQLLASTATSTQQVQSSAPATGTLGQNINIKV